ncbi:PREDICTED: uncharacterized protein LOC109130504 [Camelina sativa]|uniref:Uncharacterized protein LOC109130504 n=1 Tax=Camelina sativa TaxID=90675 RepID=A0ABM1R9E8_CAMSA|nr:PREDICTED: uncharacterized protein LOC109130504 [Camelina sativa]
MAHPHFPKAMDVEITALKLLRTWYVESLPQQEGIDYIETFSPVAKLASVKLVLGLAAKHSWRLTQMDVTNAFLHGTLDEEIYMSLPQGYTPANGAPLPPNAVCRLHNSLYGLKQASRQWYHCFSTVLLNEGFEQAHGDNTLFVKQTGDSFIALLDLQAALHRAFKIKDLGAPKYFLGLEIARNASGILLCQRKYALDILAATSMLACKPENVPMDPTVNLSRESETFLEDATSYRELVGRLLYLTITRPDITFAVNNLSQFLSCPTDVHYAAALRVLWYLKNNPGQGIFFSVDTELCLNAFSDANYGTCPDSRRSVTGFCIYLGSSLINWKSKK